MDILTDVDIDISLTTIIRLNPAYLETGVKWRGCGARSLHALFLVLLAKQLQLAGVRTTRLEGTFGQLSGTIQLPEYACSAVCDNIQPPWPLPASPQRQELAAWPMLYLLSSCVLLGVLQKAPVFKQLQ